MGLNIVKENSNMYQFVNATWNTVKGACYHDCSYCYMKRWGYLNPARFDDKELKTDLGEGNIIFVGSSCDMFADDIPKEWIDKTLAHISMYLLGNRYLFQTKNPSRIVNEMFAYPINSIITTTIETNRIYPEMGKAPYPGIRANAMNKITGKKMVTIEPIMDFDLIPMVELIKRCEPTHVNIGADSGSNNLPEPSWEKILKLKEELIKFTTVAKKKNLKRLIK